MYYSRFLMEFHWWLGGKKKNSGSIPGSGRFPGEGTGNPLQYSCLENSTDRETQRMTVMGLQKSQIYLND